MKALSVTQPWATLIVIGAKEFETRSWATKFRDRFFVHASKGFPAWAREACEEPFFREALTAAGYSGWRSLPVGAIVGTAMLADCIRTDDAVISEREREFGDFYPGRFAYRLEDPHRYSNPFLCSGKLGFWDVLPDILQMLSKGARYYVPEIKPEPTLF